MSIDGDNFKSFVI